MIAMAMNRFAIMCEDGACHTIISTDGDGVPPDMVDVHNTNAPKCGPHRVSTLPAQQGREGWNR